MSDLHNPILKKKHQQNNASRLGAGFKFISVCFETRWLGQKLGFYDPERTFIMNKYISSKTLT